MAHAHKSDFVFQRNGRVHLNRRGESVQSNTGCRGVRVSGQTLARPCSEVEYNSSGYPLQSPISPSLPLSSVTVCHHVSNGLYKIWSGNFLKSWTWSARGGSFAWGWLSTALQVGRSRVRFPKVSLEFFIDVILPAALWPWGWLSL